MNTASAYPNSALSAGVLTAMALVVAATVACWLIAVFVAAREPRVRQGSGGVTLATPDQTTEDQTTEDRHGEADSDQGTHQQGVAA